jgi:molybdopterin synthase sulfur carrier subunit
MTIRVQVHLYSTLRGNRFDEDAIELREGATVTDLLDKLGLALEEVGTVMVNAKSGTFQQTLKPGDRIALLPEIGGG